MAIAKAASESGAFKVARLRESIAIVEGQDEITLGESSSEEVGLEDDDQAALDDLGRNAGLRVVWKESHTLCSTRRCVFASSS